MSNSHHNRDEIKLKTASATRWSAFTELCARLASPIVSMVLARLLTPEAFGVVATVNVVISLADMLSDAGFQKFLVQHDFKDKDALYQSTTVAFWTNLVVSFAIWAFISAFSEPFATLLGSPGYGVAIIAAGASLPLTSFSSIQISLFKREFDFKTLFYARLLSAFAPIAVTVPLAFVFHNFWALIIGTVAVNLCNAVFLTIKSEWKPSAFYSFRIFEEMFSYSWWILLESVTTWATSYLDVLFVGRALSSYYLGLYKTSTSTVGGLMNVVVEATASPLFSALSRTKDNTKLFFETYFSYIRALAFFLVPLGFGIWLYSDLVTKIFLGSQWLEASQFIGLWGLTGTVTYVLGTYCNGLYNAVGKTYLSFTAQLILLAVLIPGVIVAAPFGFEVLVLARSAIRLVLVIAQIFIMYFTFHVTPLKSLRLIARPMLLSTIMCAAAFALQQVSDSISWNVFSVFICIAVYLSASRFLFKGELTRSLDVLGFNFIDKIQRKLTHVRKEEE